MGISPTSPCDSRLGRNLYGTTAFGGAGGVGVVYKLDPRGNDTVLYAFPGDADGQYPYNNGVSLGPDGHLYGTTDYGGQNGHGVAYRLDGDDHETVLYTFDLLTANGFGQPDAGFILRLGRQPLRDYFHRPSQRGLRLWRGVPRKKIRLVVRRCFTTSRTDPMVATPTEA